MKIKRRDGRLVEVGPGYLLQDGESFIVPMHLMDSRARAFFDSAGNPSGCRPGFLFGDDGSESDLDAAHRQYKADIAERWKSDRWSSPVAKPAPRPQHPNNDGSQQASVDAAYREYNERISQRWRK